MSIELVACPTCGGCGSVLLSIAEAPWDFETTRPCEGCLGHGYVPVEADPCFLGYFVEEEPGDLVFVGGGE